MRLTLSWALVSSAMLLPLPMILPADALAMGLRKNWRGEIEIGLQRHDRVNAWAQEYIRDRSDYGIQEEIGYLEIRSEQMTTCELFYGDLPSIQEASDRISIDLVPTGNSWIYRCGGGGMITDSAKAVYALELLQSRTYPTQITIRRGSDSAILRVFKDGLSLRLEPVSLPSWAKVGEAAVVLSEMAPRPLVPVRKCDVTRFRNQPTHGQLPGLMGGPTGEVTEEACLKFCEEQFRSQKTYLKEKPAAFRCRWGNRSLGRDRF